MKYWRARSLPKLKTFINDLIFVKNNFYPATIKNDNGAVETRKKLCGANRTNFWKTYSTKIDSLVDWRATERNQRYA